MKCVSHRKLCRSSSATGRFCLRQKPATSIVDVLKHLCGIRLRVLVRMITEQQVLDSLSSLGNGLVHHVPKPLLDSLQLFGLSCVLLRSFAAGRRRRRQRWRRNAWRLGRTSARCRSRRDFQGCISLPTFRTPATSLKSSSISAPSTSLSPPSCPNCPGIFRTFRFGSSPPGLRKSAGRRGRRGRFPT